jgi:PAS domain S-box-containing protein
VCIPLLGDSRVLGVLNLSTSEPGAFGAHHTRVLGIVANQIASALLGAELYRELQSFSGRLESEVAERTRELERKTEALHRKNDQVTDLYFSLERAQRELEERNAALVEALTFNDNIVESLHVGIGVIRHDGHVVSWNRAMGTLTRGLLPKEAVLGRAIGQVSEETREKFALGAALSDALRDAIPFTDRGRVVRTPDGGEMHLDVRHLPVSIIADGETHVIVVIEDVTDAVHLHQSRVKAERLAAITETMVSVNHEVNNPLAVILGYAQILLDRLEKDDQALVAGPKAREELARIEGEALRIREITQKLASLIEPVVTLYPVSDGLKMVDLRQSR